jgi:hypothetical protein
MLQRQIIQLHEEIAGDVVLMEHLVAEFNITLGRIRTLKAKLRSRTVHPMAVSPVFVPVNDGKGFRLGRYRDFLERPKRTMARRL